MTLQWNSYLIFIFIIQIATHNSLCLNAPSLSYINNNGFEYSFCGEEEYPQCILTNDNTDDNYYSCAKLDLYSYTDTQIDVCGCDERYILSNIIVLIDGTNFTNDYGWYFWSTSWIKLWYYDLTRFQPLLNITYIYYGSDIEFIKRGNPVSFFGTDWGIPTEFENDQTPDLCQAFDKALQIFDNQQDQDRQKILIMLSNTTPNLPDKNNLCTNIDNTTFSDITTYSIKTSPNVNLSIVEQEYGEFDVCLNMFNSSEYTTNWAQYFDENDYSYKPNSDAYNYLNLMVSTISDFVCLNSDICQSFYYSQGKDDNYQICQFSCIEDDFSCIDNSTNDNYYIIETYNGSQPMSLTQSESNDMCLQYFGTNLASINTNIDQQNILSVLFFYLFVDQFFFLNTINKLIITTITKQLMEFYNSSNCWIGLNDTDPLFTLDNIEYYQWIDQSINSFNFVENTENIDEGCISITKSGKWKINDCNDVSYHCFICNSADNPIITISSDS